MSRYETAHYSNRREYLNWLADVYGVERADVILLSSILGTDQDFGGLPAALAGLPTTKHTQETVFPQIIPNVQNSPQFGPVDKVDLSQNCVEKSLGNNSYLAINLQRPG